jgi:hypothetical protein
MARLSPLVHYPFIIPQTAIFCIATEPGKDSSFAAGIRKTSKFRPFYLYLN